MSKFTEMSDEQYFDAMDEFTAKYEAPLPKPVKKLDPVCVIRPIPVHFPGAI